MQRIKAPNAPMLLGPLAEPAQRRAVFAEAFRLASGQAPPDMAGLDRMLEPQSLGGEPLFLAMSGLMSARSGITAAMQQAPNELAITLAQQELARIRAIWLSRGLKITDTRPLDRHQVALATLNEGFSEAAAHEVIARETASLHLTLPDGTEPVRAALHTALPGHSGGIAPILPDILGEAALIAIWGDSALGIDAIRRLASSDPAAVTRVVIRTCQDFLIRGHQAPLRWLQVLRDSVSDLDQLIALGNAMPERTAELREATLKIFQSIVDRTSAVDGRGDEILLAVRAVALSHLSAHLAALGRHE